MKEVDVSSLEHTRGLDWYNYKTNEPNALNSNSSEKVKNTIYATLTKDNSSYVVGYIVK